jgi:hypothetical protein
MTHSYVKRNVGENRRVMKNGKSRDTVNIGYTGHRRKSNKTNNTTQKRKMMRNTDTTKYRGLTQVLTKGKQFMPRIRRPAFYSYSSDVFYTTIPKQTKTKHK